MTKPRKFIHLNLIMFFYLISSFSYSDTSPKNELECIEVGGTWDKLSNSYCIRIEEEKCKKKGGIWQRVCISQSLACLTPYKDAGKSCTDGSQCEGKKCLYTGNKPNDIGVISGVCLKDDNPCGTFMLIESGASVGGESVD